MNTTMLVASLFPLLFSLVSARCGSDLIATTTSGTFEGFYPHKAVCAFLGIPYAEPPLGPLRFAPPESLVSENKTVRDASKFGKTCFQFRYKTIGFEKRGPTTGESEDCLTVNVWGPADRKGKELLPSLIWTYGGGFGEGASSDFSYDPLDLVKTHQDILFVSFKYESTSPFRFMGFKKSSYRLNIFGFPETPALPDSSKNLGLRDQRLALEWLQSNIASFGGDPKRMTLFGQSAGSTSVAVHSFWHPKDPIVQAMIMQSGQAESTLVNDPSQFIRVANRTGCVNENRTAELECMRALDPLQLRNGVSEKQYNYFAEPYGGSMTVDNLTFFPPTDYIQRGVEGEFAKIPYLIGSNNNEGDGVVPFTPDKGLNRTFADAQTLGAYTCVAALSAGYRAASGVPVWRYRYMGAFPWQSNFRWLANRAPHGAELPLIFGSYEKTQYKDLIGRDLEAVRYIQNAWVAFAKDPEAALSKLGWPRYNPKNDTLVELFPHNKIGVELVSPNKYDAPCAKLGGKVDTSGYGPYCEEFEPSF